MGSRRWGGGAILAGAGAVVVTTAVQGGETEEACADICREELQQAGDGVAEVDVVDNTCSECFNGAVLKVEGDTHVIFFRTEGERLRCLDAESQHPDSEKGIP